VVCRQRSVAPSKSQSAFTSAAVRSADRVRLRSGQGSGIVTTGLVGSDSETMDEWNGSRAGIVVERGIVPSYISAIHCWCGISVGASLDDNAEESRVESRQADDG
jgi:hypothetical protein